MNHLQQLANGIARERVWRTDEGETITVSKTSRVAAGLYEKIRTALENDEEHLLRRNAIRRLICRHRNTVLNATDVSRGMRLLSELIWADYLPNDAVPVSLAAEIDAIFEKYDHLFMVVEEADNAPALLERVEDIMSVEVEYLIEPPYADEALAGMMFSFLKNKVDWAEETTLTDQEKEFLLYIAIHRTLLKSNTPTLRYRLFRLYEKDWATATGDQLNEMSKRFAEIMGVIDAHIDHEYGDTLYRLTRKNALAFRVLGDIVRAYPNSWEEALQSPEESERSVKKVVDLRYRAFRSKLAVGIVRTVLFLLCTKTVIAFLTEVPYELVFMGHIEYVSLLINIVFHPIILGLIGITVSLPEKRNTKALVLMVNEVLGVAHPEQTTFHTLVKKRRPWHRGFMRRAFFIIYWTLFVAVYALIAWGLMALLHFNVVSMVLFLFFFSLAAFLGIKIRQSVRDLLVVERSGSVFSVAFDIFLLPVVQVGRYLSLRAKDWNVLIFFLDFIIEAPFKLAVEVIESWINFVREQKETL